MILAIDTDVMIPWLVKTAPGHAKARKLVESELNRDGGRIAIVQQVCWEFLHVVSDARLFTAPLDLGAAIALVRFVWNAPETSRITPSPKVLPRVLELMAAYRLGRKRILDTSLAATLECAGVSRLATYNTLDFQCFEFISVVNPDEGPKPAGT